MLFRIQTLYLLIVLILNALMGFSPIVKFFGEVWIVLEVTKLSTNEKVLPFTILLGLILIITLVAILLFKKRILQIRLLIINIVLLAGILAFIGFYSYNILSTGNYKAFYQPACIYPLISIIFTILAIHAIKKDEQLVRSIDRIR